VKVSGVFVATGPGEAELLQTSIPALRPQVDELVVVANGPGSRPGDFAGDACVLENDRPLGFSANVNQGIEASSGEDVVISNPDAVPEANCVRELVAFADARPRCGIAGPRMLNPDGTPTSRSPITDSFGGFTKWQTLLMVLWGATAGQAVVWYTGQFYAFNWMLGKTTGNVTLTDASLIVAIGLMLGTPFFIVFGALSDRIGRKKIMMAGNLLGAALILPIFYMMRQNTPAAGPGHYHAAVLVLGVFLLVVLVTMVYGPIAAFLVESFPSKVRYTSVSLPYHIGNGYFGGFLPLIATALVARTGNIYAGLAYPTAIALMTFIVGSIVLPETGQRKIWDEV